MRCRHDSLPPAPFFDNLEELFEELFHACSSLGSCAGPQEDLLPKALDMQSEAGGQVLHFLSREECVQASVAGGRGGDLLRIGELSASVVAGMTSNVAAATTVLRFIVRSPRQASPATTDTLARTLRNRRSSTGFGAPKILLDERFGPGRWPACASGMGKRAANGDGKSQDFRQRPNRER